MGYWDKDIVDRLKERASFAREEDTGTSVADATHFEQASKEIERLRELVERAQSIILSSYVNWHADASAAIPRNGDEA